MKKYLLTLSALIMLTTVAFGQRYLTDLYTDVNVDQGVQYGENWYFFPSNIEDFILTPNPADSPYVAGLNMDIYSGDGDTATNRIPVIVMHTGNFIPRFFNGATTGSRTDNAVTHIATRLAKRGYVAFPISYRFGWDPISADADVRRGTILNAIYRALHDVQTCVRFLKKTVAEDGNPYGIDPSKIVLMGFGTGGYLATNYVSLDRPEELQLQKFTDVNGNLYIDMAMVGNIDGSGGTLNVHNYPTYDNDVMVAINAGGALGDSSWIEPGEPMSMSFHCPDDGFAPFNHGIVIVPTTQESVVDVSGSKWIIKRANEVGNNQVIMDADYTDPYSMASYTALASNHPMLGLNPDNYEGLFPFIRPATGAPFEEASPWDWWDPATVNATITGINNLAGTSLDAAAIMASSGATNPDMSQGKSEAYIDTIVNYISPRLVAAMQVGIEDLNDQVSANTFIYPNPATSALTVKVNGFLMNAIEIYNMNGALVFNATTLGSSRADLNIDGLSTGLYLVKVRTDEGFSTQKLTVK